MAGDTLRGIGKKQIAEALENASALERTTAPNGTAGAPAEAVDVEARPERSLDDLPSERTGYPTNNSGAHAHPQNHAPEHAEVAAAMAITNATTLVQDASAVPAAAANTTLVDDAAPLTSGTAASRSGPNRVSFGTMIGHEMHAVQARVAAAADVDAAARGTAHGRDVHLSAHPAMAIEPETAPAVAPVASLGVPSEPAATPAAPARDSVNEFSGPDHSFFETAPVNDEYEPENPRGRLYTRLAVSGAVVAIVSVVVVAWVNQHGSSDEPPPVQVKSQPAVTAPMPIRTAVAAPAPPARLQEAPPTTTIPSSVPERIAVTTPPPRPAKTPTLASPTLAPPTLAPPAPAPKPAPVAAAGPAKPAPIAAAAPAPKPVPVAAAPVRELRTPPPPPQKKPTAVATAAPRPPAPTPPRAAAPAPPRAVPTPPRAPAPPPPAVAARPAPAPAAKAARPESAPSRPVAKAAPARPSKPAAPRGKTKYDPDGTLPLSFE